MNYELPTALEIGGREYQIRSDFRAALDICAALSDPELSEQDKALAALSIFYPEIGEMPGGDWEEALRQCFWFINGGEDEEKGPRQPKLMDWEQDFKYIAAPVNRVMGREIRSMEYLHWWSFLAAYMEIGGDCTFAQIVSLRDKLARHQKLDKAEREWYRRNRRLVEFKKRYTAAEDALVQQWT